MTPSFPHSPEQLVIFDEITSGTSSLIVEAAAGSGKTSTIVFATSLIPRSKSCIFVAFNKSIATELESRLPPHVQARTFHSFWFTQLQRSLPRRPQVNGDKVRDIFKKSVKWSEFERYQTFVPKLVSLAKNSGLGVLLPDTPTEWFALISHFQLVLDDGDEDTAVKHARKALADSNALLSVIDFDDMLYLPLLRNLSSDKFNFIFVDEAQDTNGVQRALLHRMLATPPLGRLIAVGDPFQAIYGFRGADCDALDLLRSEFNCKTLPLSVSWRCSKAVVREVHKKVKFK